MAKLTAETNEFMQKMNLKMKNGNKLTNSELETYLGILKKLFDDFEPMKIIKTDKKAPVKKAPVKKAPVKKAPVKKAPVKKAPVKKAPVISEIFIVEYSDKAIAVFGDTKPVKNQLISLGGRFNRFLKNGKDTEPGWIFSKKITDIETIKAELS